MSPLEVVMEFKMTKQQVARGARPDGETFDKLVLIKRVSELRATYQIRLLTYRAVEERKMLVIDVPKHCKVHDDLKVLAKEFPRNFSIVRN
jgi:hypothetical protein